MELLSEIQVSINDFWRAETTAVITKFARHSVVVIVFWAEFLHLYIWLSLIH